MGKLIKSDFYKILHTKYFYVCAVLSVLMSALLVHSYYMQVSQYGIYASLLNINSVSAIYQGISGFTLFSTIAISLFIPGDFSHGTIKNIISSGVSRISIYFSKVIVSVTMTIFYMLLSCITSFVMGSIIWEVGEYTRDVYIDLLQSLSFYLLANIALISLYIMVGFLIRKSGITIAINLGVPTVVSVVLVFADYAIANWLKIENFTCRDYLASTYISKALSFSSLTNNEITTGLIVCGSYILISALIGIITFKRRDIK